MRQLVQSVKDGTLRIIEAPDPIIGATEVLVATSCSLLSAGTERAVRQLASASLLTKAKARPDLVRQVIAKAKVEGLQATRKAVETRLQDEMPLGYSAAGRVLAVGEAVSGIAPGMRVATASAGHGDRQVVPGLLTVPVPAGVTDSQAAFGAVAAIALQGLRQADVQTGGTIVVIGLGLIGQLTLRIGHASGLRMIGIDIQKWLIDFATRHGANAMVETGDSTTRNVLEATRGRGADAVIIAAATPSSKPAMRSTQLLRDRGRLVIVGDIGLDLKRTPFYEKELEIRFARSYGPGRYERAYEDYAIDYPIGHMRWTEGRNIEAYLDLLASGKLAVDDLVTRTFPLERAQEAYDALGSGAVIGVQFTYQETRPKLGSDRKPRTIAKPGKPSMGLIGAGQFVQATLLPAFGPAGLEMPQAITSSGGTSAVRVAQRFGVSYVAHDVEELLNLPHIDTVMIASRHDSHANLTVKALKAGKHVFVEKPLALTFEELAEIESALDQSGTILWVGFNRRYAETVVAAKRILDGTAGPLVINYRVNADEVPATHWYHDRRQGGRLLGEVCHFIDTANWLVGHSPESVIAFGESQGEAMLQQNLAILLRYSDGSTAAITYGVEGSGATSKERLEITGRGHSVLIDNFVALWIDGKKVNLRARTKGHIGQLANFAKAVHLSHEDTADTRMSLLTSRVTLHAAASLLSGEPQSSIQYGSAYTDVASHRGAPGTCE